MLSFSPCILRRFDAGRGGRDGLTFELFAYSYCCAVLFCKAYIYACSTCCPVAPICRPSCVLGLFCRFDLLAARTHTQHVVMPS